MAVPIKQMQPVAAATMQLYTYKYGDIDVYNLINIYFLICKYHSGTHINLSETRYRFIINVEPHEKLLINLSKFAEKCGVESQERPFSTATNFRKTIPFHNKI